MSILRKIVSYVFVISIVIITLFTAIDLAAVKDRNFYKEQYIKNGTYNFIDIEEDELLRVTDVLLDYMTGKIDSLYVEAYYNGKTQDFFDETEKAHMVDVRNLFVAGINLRRVLIAVAILSVIFLAATGKNTLNMLSKAYVIFTTAVIAIFAVLIAVISRDFTAAFIKFHEMFFTNDLWLLDVSVSKLINMVPEPFFINTAVRIGVLFGAALIVLYALSVYILIRHKKAQGD